MLAVGCMSRMSLGLPRGRRAEARVGTWAAYGGPALILFLHNRYRTTGGEERAVDDLLWLVREKLGEQPRC